jgi:hypothetical protein
MILWTTLGVLPLTRQGGTHAARRRPARQERQLLVNPTDGSTVLEEHLRHLLG